ncbi:MAG: hypothetical protein J6Z45_02570 [Oscillospiraceae bacterium]|nr:hypothetical protein [Oscillospiraceae bacterium]
MVTVRTCQELADAVRRDEVMLHLEGEAKYFYEKNVGDTIGGGVVGAVPGLLLGGPVGAVLGGVIGAAVSGSVNSQNGSDREIARFLMRYYRKTSTGLTFIELTHR